MNRHLWAIALVGLATCVQAAGPECPRFPVHLYGPWVEPDVYPRLVPPLDSPPVLRFSDAFECRTPTGLTNICCLACDRILDLQCRAPDYCIEVCANRGWGPVVARATHQDEVVSAIRAHDPEYGCVWAH